MRLFRHWLLAAALFCASGLPALAASTTFDSANCNANIVLSNGNLTASKSSPSGTWDSCRTTSPNTYTVGTNNKVVFEANVTADSSGGFMICLGDSTVLLTTDCGQSGNAAGAQINSSGGTANFNHGNVTQVNGTCVTPTGGNLNATVWIALDANTGNVWCSATCNFKFQTNQDPDTGGLPWATFANTPTLYVFFSSQSNGGASDAVTLNMSPNLTGCQGITSFRGWDAAAAAIPHLLPLTGAGQ